MAGTRERQRKRQRSKKLEAASAMAGMGLALLLLPALSAQASLKTAFAPVRPAAAVMLIAGIALAWWHMRGLRSSSASARQMDQSDAAALVRRAPAMPRAEKAHGVPAERGPVIAVNRPAAAIPLPGDWSEAVFRAIEWRRFEAVVEMLFRQAGFITKAQSHGADGGVDVWLYSKHQPDGKAVSIVQCKHWQGKRVGVDKVRELRGVMASHEVRRGQFATTSDFTPEAEAFARENGIHLLNVRGLLSLIGQRTVEQQKELLAVALEGEYWRPTCASCGTKMIERKAKSSGSSSWGCTAYPRCRNTLQMQVRSTSAL